MNQQHPSVLEVVKGNVSIVPGPVIVKAPVQWDDGHARIITEVHVSKVVQLEDGSKGAFKVGRRKLSALWDTGATRTCVIPRVVDESKLEFSGHDTMYGLDNLPKERELYHATMAIPEKPLDQDTMIAFHSTTVAKLEEDDQLHGLDMIIGMDLIMRGDFWISGAKQGDPSKPGQFCFCYPSTGVMFDIQRGPPSSPDQ